MPETDDKVISTRTPAGPQESDYQPLLSRKEFNIGVDRMTAAMLISGFVGVLDIWIALSVPGNVCIDPPLNTGSEQKSELAHTMGIPFLVTVVLQ